MSFLILALITLSGGEKPPFETRETRWTGDDRSESVQVRVLPNADYSEKPLDLDRAAYSVRWDEPVVGPLGRSLRVAGQLRVAVGDAAPRPVDWLQGIGVYVSKTPGREHDWFKGLNVDRQDPSGPVFDGAWATTFTRPDGRFEADVSADEAGRYLRGGRVRTAVSLGENLGMVDFSTAAPAVAESVTWLTLPPARALPDGVLALAEAKGWPFANADCTTIIRAAATLHSLGEREAVATIRHYIRLSDEADAFSSSWWPDGAVVFWVLRCLYEPTDQTQVFRRPGLYVLLPDGQDTWPLRPMTVESSIPFMVGRQIGGSGAPESPESGLRYMLEHGRFRDNPLLPETDPVTAVLRVQSRPEYSQLDEYAARGADEILRRQAVETLRRCMESAGVPVDGMEKSERWQAARSFVATHSVRWDSKKGSFVAEAKE